MPGDEKTEKDAAKTLQTMSKDLESLPKKSKADLDKGDKLVKDLERDAKKSAKSGGKDKHSAASEKVQAIWARMKKHRDSSMKSVDRLARTCKAQKGRAILDTMNDCEPAVGEAIKNMVAWMGQIDELEKAAKGLDPKSPMAKGVKDALKIQRRVNEDAAKTVRTNFAKLLNYREQLRKMTH